MFHKLYIYCMTGHLLEIYLLSVHGHENNSFSEIEFVIQKWIWNRSILNKMTVEWVLVSTHCHPLSQYFSVVYMGSLSAIYCYEPIDGFYFIFDFNVHY